MLLSCTCVGIPFNAATYDSFHIMIEAIGQFGPGMKKPSMYDLRVPLLRKEVATITKKRKNTRQSGLKKVVRSCLMGGVIQSCKKI